MSLFNSKTSLSLIAMLALIAACGGDKAPEEAAEPAAEAAAAVEEAADKEAPAEEAAPADAEAESAFPTADLIDPNAATAEELAAVVPGLGKENRFPASAVEK